MCLQFRILGSSSSGNAALLTTAGSKVLIDAGFSARKLDQMLTQCGESLAGIDAIFLTHEHSDHATGIKGLRRYPHIQVFANRETMQAVQARLTFRPTWQIFETGAMFGFRDLEVTAFSIPHDAYDPVGYFFEGGGDTLFAPRRSVAWATDLGYVPANVSEKIRHADFLVLEANHDTEMLEKDERRPWSLKQRIRGRHGHLSNDAALELLCGAESPRWRHVCLAHLSRDCNDVGLVERHFSVLRERGRAFGLSVIDPVNGIGPAYDLATL
jgi:phosphoribosyl 1,2-cyclic phosphodiesterase